MLAHWVVKHFDGIEHVLPSLLARFVYPATDALAFERREEALSDGMS
jgi:hypothetical protein